MPYVLMFLPLNVIESTPLSCQTFLYFAAYQKPFILQFFAELLENYPSENN